MKLTINLKNPKYCVTRGKDKGCPCINGSDWGMSCNLDFWDEEKFWFGDKPQPRPKRDDKGIIRPTRCIEENGL